MLSPGGSITGRVRREDGAPVAQASVHCMGSPGVYGTESTDTDGRFQFLDLPAGSYTVTAEPPPGNIDLGIDRQAVKLSEGGAAQCPELLTRFDRIAARIGRDLEHGFHQLGLDLPGGCRLEQSLDRVDELERLGVENHQLLFDADREGRAAEPVFHAGEPNVGVTRLGPARLDCGSGH